MIGIQIRHVRAKTHFSSHATSGFQQYLILGYGPMARNSITDNYCLWPNIAMEHDPFVDDVLGGSPHLVSRLYPCVITGLSRVSSLITGVIIHLLTGMSHQVPFDLPVQHGNISWRDGNFLIFRWSYKTTYCKTTWK